MTDPHRPDRRVGNCERSTFPAVLMALALAAGACSNAVGYSSPVGINLKAKGEDVAGGVVTDGKNITTENGNPFAAFISRARTELDGRPPGRVEVDSATLLLAGSSKGVTALDQVIAGRTDVQFVMNDTNNTFNAAHLDNPTGAGPVNLVVDFDSRMLGEQDLPKLIGGNFKVVLRAPAAATFAGSKDREADLQVTFQFAAYP